MIPTHHLLAFEDRAAQPVAGPPARPGRQHRRPVLRPGQRLRLAPGAAGRGDHRRCRSSPPSPGRPDQPPQLPRVPARPRPAVPLLPARTVPPAPARVRPLLPLGGRRLAACRFGTRVDGLRWLPGAGLFEAELTEVASGRTSRRRARNLVLGVGGPGRAGRPGRRHGQGRVPRGRVPRPPRAAPPGGRDHRGWVGPERRRAVPGAARRAARLRLPAGLADPLGRVLPDGVLAAGPGALHPRLHPLLLRPARRHPRPPAAHSGPALQGHRRRHHRRHRRPAARAHRGRATPPVRLCARRGPVPCAGGGRWRLAGRQWEQGRDFTLEADCVVLATGYQPEPPACLDGLAAWSTGTRPAATASAWTTGWPPTRGSAAACTCRTASSTPTGSAPPTWAWGRTGPPPSSTPSPAGRSTGFRPGPPLPTSE